MLILNNPRGWVRRSKYEAEPQFRGLDDLNYLKILWYIWLLMERQKWVDKLLGY